MSETDPAAPAPHDAAQPRRLGGLPEPTPTTIAGVLAALPLVLFVYWGWDDAGFARTTWLPGSLFLLGLATLALIVGGRSLPVPPTALVALAALAAFTVWNALTILWAGAPDVAWDGTNRTLLYLCVFAFYVAVPMTPRAAVRLAGGFTLAVAALALVTVLRATVLGDPTQWYIDGRLAAPSDYSNADAALFLATLWPAIHFASRRAVHPLLRGCFLASAGILVEAAILCQSRTSLVAVPVVGALFVAFSPGRLRVGLSLGLVGLAVAATGRTLVDVYSAIVQSDGGLQAVRDAGHLALLAAGALLVVGCVVGFVDRALIVPPRVSRVAGVVALVLVAAAVAAGSALVVERHGNPVAAARDGWSRFKSGQADDNRVAHLTSGVGTNRYDLWRVALLEFRSAPLVGIGSDNYAVPYLARRAMAVEEPLYPHSLPLRLLSQTGLVGTALFVVFLGAALVGAWRSRRRRAPLENGTAVAALAFTGYWLVHGSADWLWEIPGVGAPAIALLALPFALAEGRPALRSLGRPATAAVAMCAVVGVASLAPPWLAAKETDLAASRWPASPAVAFDRLSLARRLNPLSDEADVIAAVISQRLNTNTARERAAWDRALAQPEQLVRPAEAGAPRRACGPPDRQARPDRDREAPQPRASRCWPRWPVRSRRAARRAPRLSMQRSWVGRLYCCEPGVDNNRVPEYRQKRKPVHDPARSGRSKVEWERVGR